MFWRLLILLTFILPFSGKTDELCSEALEKLVNENISKDKINELLKLQGQITLHRMAWAHLTLNKKDQKYKRPIEETIRVLLREKYQSADEEFIKARELFETQPLSRHALLEIAPQVSEVLLKMKKEKTEENELYFLNESDIQLLDILATQEGMKNGAYDHAMVNMQGKRGTLNFLKLINSSYTYINELPDDQARLAVDLNLNGLEKTISTLEKSLMKEIESIELPMECLPAESCEAPATFAALYEQDQNIKDLFWAAIKNRSMKDDYLPPLTYGSFWLQTAKNKSTFTKTTTPVKTVTKTPVVKSHTDGLMIHDPVGVIVKDKSGRESKNWEGRDKDYLHAMAEAIMKNKKVFMVGGEVYDRATGKLINGADEFIKQNSMLSGLYKSFDPKILKHMYAAQSNNEWGFILNGKLYGVSGLEMDPVSVIIQSRKEKSGVTRAPAEYKTYDKVYLNANALAILKKENIFVVDGVTYDTWTGRGKTSPLNQPLPTIDYKEYRTDKKQLNTYTDEDIITNFLRNKTKKTNECGTYTIVDKKEAHIRIYKMDGSLLFDKEILLGGIKSDKKSIFYEYEDYATRTSNKKTGAGVYFIGGIRTGGNYETKLNNNSFFLTNDKNLEQSTLGIHQVPKNHPERYALFNNGNLEDNRVTGACINLKPVDFEEYEKLTGKGCAVYVLPEEDGNRFVVKNNQLIFTTDNKVSTQDLNSYNFTPIKEYKPISITVNENKFQPETENIVTWLTSPVRTLKIATSKRYVNTLSSEKEKLMKILKLDNDDYNDLALVAFGILGNESKFGGSGKLLLKESNQDLVWLSKKFKGNDSPNSRGLTQIKVIPDVISKNYPHINSWTLINPENAAIATMGYLAEALSQLKSIRTNNNESGSGVQIPRDELMNYISYLYQGRRGMLTSDETKADPEHNGYVQRLKEYAGYLTITQKME